MPNAGSRAEIFLPYLNKAMEEYSINTPARQAAFLAQIAHESGELKYVKEIASGRAYEMRLDLGNTKQGDGLKYKGRGLIQLTGKFNYISFMMSSGVDCVEHPELLEQPENACRSAAWFWQLKGLNTLADEGDFLKISIRINGRNKTTGLPNGWEDRQKYYELAKKILYKENNNVE